MTTKMPNKKIKTIFNVVEEKSKPARMNLYGFIGATYWDDEEQSVTTKAVNQALKGITADEIDVHINSYGGDAFEGIGIYNALKQSDKTINVYIDALAASAASIVAMAGDKIYMPKNAQMMVHHAATMIYGDASDLENAIADLNKMDRSLVMTYMTRFTGTEDELIALLDAETFLNADEAVALGLADEVIEYVEPQELQEPKGPEEPESEPEKPESEPEKPKPEEPEEPKEPAANIKEKLVAKYHGKIAANMAAKHKKQPTIAEKLINLAREAE